MKKSNSAKSTPAKRTAKRKRPLSKHSENKWAILAVLALAQFMVVLDVSIVNVAIPSIQKELAFSANNLQWIVTAYTLTFGGLLLLGGRAADLFGRRKLFISAVIAFALTSLLCGLAQTEAQLIIARGLQGIAAAFMSPVALSIVITEFKEGRDRNKAMGVWAGVAAGGGAAGVLFGGILTQYLSWRWNFFVNVPIGLLVAFFASRLLPHHIGEERVKPKLDTVGALLATSGLMTLVYGLSKAPELGWESSTVWRFIITAFVLLGLFVFNESRTKQPLMPLEIFQIRNVAGGNAAFFAIACSMFSMFFFLTLYIQGVLGYSPVKAGLCFLPITITVGMTAAIVSNLVGKFGYKPTMVTGPLTLATGLFVLSNSLEVNGSYLANVLPGLVICALGMGQTFVSGTLAVTSGVPKHFSGLASGLMNTAQQVGGALGLSILSAIAFTTIPDEIANGTPILQAQVDGYSRALYVAVWLAVSAAVIVLLVVKNHKVDPKSAQPAAH